MQGTERHFPLSAQICDLAGAFLIFVLFERN
jgi:hypothetical protein